MLLDTCAAIWLMHGDPISEQSRTSITAPQTGNFGIYVSPITAWEIATLVVMASRSLRPTPAG
jgi:PIN domain nuclease of toxin-antitoxin system